MTLRQVLPLLGDPSLFADRWPDVPHHRLRAATVLTPALTWSAIDSLLNDQSIRLPAFRMVRDNTQLPVQSIIRPERSTSLGITGLADPVSIVTELANGATLVLQGIHRFWPPLRDVARLLAAEIGHAVFINAYLTPASARGFGVHHDPYHAWLAQISGYKTWRLWAPDSNPAVDPPDREVVLAEGDVLWIPRGWWHAGSSGDQPSLHLTFTVWAARLDDVLHAMVDELTGRLKSGGELPPNAFRDERRTNATVKNAVAEIVQLIGEMNEHALTDRIVGACLDRFDPLPAQPIATVMAAGQDLDFHTHPESILRSVANESGVQLTTADAVLTVLPAQVAACTALLSRTDSFGLDEVAGPLNEGHPSLLSQLTEARLVCSAMCRKS